MSEIKPSVCYRTGPLTRTDYDEAIQALIDARDGDDRQGCPVCHDGHSGQHCHHNPLILARKWAAATSIYVCFHCGFEAKTEAEGLAHFGKAGEYEAPICVRLGQMDAPGGVSAAMAKVLARRPVESR